MRPVSPGRRRRKPPLDARVELCSDVPPIIPAEHMQQFAATYRIHRFDAGGMCEEIVAAVAVPTGVVRVGG